MRKGLIGVRVREAHVCEQKEGGNTVLKEGEYGLECKHIRVS